MLMSYLLFLIEYNILSYRSFMAHGWEVIDLSINKQITDSCVGNKI